MPQSSVSIWSLAQEQYVPSSLERKRALLMYLLVGIIITVGRWWLTEFEQFHVKQALWYRLVLILRLLLITILLVIPKIRIVFLPISIVLLVYLIIFMRECLVWNRKQGDALQKKMFYGLGSWVMTLFES